MPTDQKPTFTPPANPSQEGTPEWFYNEIMRHIEPDLLTTAIAAHGEKYAKQSPEEVLERLKAYDRAFAVFDKASADVAQEYRSEVDKIRADAKESVKKEETKERKAASQELKSIEDQFSQA